MYPLPAALPPPLPPFPIPLPALPPPIVSPPPHYDARPLPSALRSLSLSHVRGVLPLPLSLLLPPATGRIGRALGRFGTRIEELSVYGCARLTDNGTARRDTVRAAARAHSRTAPLSSSPARTLARHLTRVVLAGRLRGAPRPRPFPSTPTAAAAAAAAAAALLLTLPHGHPAAVCALAAVRGSRPLLLQAS